MRNILKFLFSWKFLIQIVLAIGIMYGGVYAIENYLYKYTRQGEATNLPDYVGFLISDVDPIIKKDGFKYFVIDSSYDKTRKPGEVLAQIPSAEARIKPGRTIYLSVNKMVPPAIQVPKLEGLSQRQAANILSTLGFNIGEESFMPDICVGCVVEAQYKGKTIESGTLLKKGAAIDLVYGLGMSNEKVPVPELLGLNLEQAKIRLKNNILKAGAITFIEALSEEDSAKAVVVRQNPEYSVFDEIRLGTPISIWLSTDTLGLNLPVFESDTLVSKFDPNEIYEETEDIPSSLPDSDTE
jgi:beta-lactam-binding protein with PASTA domain